MLVPSEKLALEKDGDVTGMVAAPGAGFVTVDITDANGLMTTTNEQHYEVGSGLNPFQVAREGVQPSIDGNTVDPDAERAAYGRAALEYRASLSFVESKVRSMLTAITGQ